MLGCITISTPCFRIQGRTNILISSPLHANRQLYPLTLWGFKPRTKEIAVPPALTAVTIVMVSVHDTPLQSVRGTPSVEIFGP